MVVCPSPPIFHPLFSPIFPLFHHPTRICVRSLAVFINVATGRGVRRGPGASERADGGGKGRRQGEGEGVWELDPPNKVNMSALYIVLQVATLGGRTCNLLLFAFVVTPAIAPPPPTSCNPYDGLSLSLSLIMHAVCFVLFLSLSAAGWKGTGRIAALCCT